VVILRPPNGPVKPGTIIAARVGSQMTLKHYYPMSEKTVQLRASNDTFPPIEVDAESLDIQGVYVSLLRGFL
jgi:repressor LexA